MSCQYVICWQANTNHSVHNTATSYQSSTLIVVLNPAALAQVDMQTAEFVKCSRCENTTLTAALTHESREIKLQRIWECPPLVANTTFQSEFCCPDCAEREKMK